MNDEEVKNLTSSMSALTKQMEKMSAQQLMQSKNIKGQEEDFEKILENSVEIENSYKRQNSYLGEMKDSLKSALQSTLKVSSTLTSIGTAAFAANIVKDLIDLDNKMTALSVRMGKGQKGILELKNSVHGLQKEFGTSYEEAVNLVETLAENKYAGNIKDAAAGIDLFSRASGVSSSEIAELTNNLSKMGGLGTDSINAMYAGMIKVQQSVGISKNGMTALTRTVNDMAFSMAAFGKSSDDIRNMTTQTTALVGAMEKVGISASKSTQLIEQLTDPDRIEENIMLYSQLGVSIEDAMSGNIDHSQLGGQFKEMADRITQMGPIAGSQFAKSMGLSYKEVTRMAKMEADSAKQIAEEAATPEEQALETMKALEKSTQGIGKQFEVGLNKVEGTLKSLPTALLLGLAVVAPLLIRQGQKIIHKIFGKKEMQASVADAVVPALENGVRKAGGKIKGETAKLENVMRGKFDAFFDRSINGKIDRAYAKATKKSPIEAMFGASNKRLIEEADAQIVGIGAKSEALSSRLLDLGVNIQDIMASNGQLSSEGIAEKSGNKKEAKAITLMIEQYNKLNKQQKALTNQKLKDAGIDVKAYKSAEKNYKAALEKEAKKKKGQEDLNRLYDERIKLLERQKKLKEEEGKLDGVALKTNRQLQESLEGQLKKNEEDAVEARAYSKMKIKKREGSAEYKKQMDNAVEEAEKKKAERGRPAKIFDSAKNFGKNIWRKTTISKNLAAASVGENEENIALTKKQKAGVVTKTIGGGVKNVGVKALGGIAKGMGKLLKSVGPMALVMTVVGKLVSKIQEPLEAMLNTIVDNLSPIVEAMMPAIEILMNTVAKHILPPMLKIAAQLLKVAHAILSPIIWIARALENVPLIGKALKGIGDTLDAATGPAVTNGLMEAADNLSNSSMSMKDSSENLNEAVKSEDGPMTIEARGASMVAVGTTRTQSYTNESSGKTAEDKLREAEEDESRKNSDKNIEGIGSNTSVLPKILNKLEEIVSIIAGKEVNIFDEDSSGVLLEK